MAKTEKPSGKGILKSLAVAAAELGVAVLTDKATR